jgi:chemotaxis protein methyltransferase CheR
MEGRLLSLSDFQKLTDVLYRRTGIAIDDKRYKLLVSKIEKYMIEKGYKNFRSYFHDVRFNKDKSTVFQDLINLVTINETYFYREKHHFEILVNEVLYELDKLRRPNEAFRILCSPSSTGEEPYSIILHLLDEGNMVEKRDIEIVGIDIDSSVIQRAKRGVFSQRSVDFLPTHILNKYFTKVGTNSYQLDRDLTEVVDFKVVNVMDKIAMQRLGKFDAIFSRNMLIYFDDISRKEVAMTYYSMLKPYGYVFLGHAESMNRIVSVFKTKRFNNQIIYQKA